MAFVATNDQHGNEIMRVVLNTEPRGKRTVACCQNLRINCGPTDLRKGRFDHRLRFHYFADEQAKPKKTQRAVLSSSAQKLEPVTTQRAALSSSAQKLNEQLNKNEQQQQQQQLRRAKSSSGQKLQRANSDMSEAQQQQLQRWQREKLTELRQQRAERRLREQQQRERRQQRRELAADAWEQWAAEARHKPRPVPMGHGLDSLRGTQHVHYENPSKWQVAAPPPQPAPAMQSTSTQTPTPRPRTGPDYKRIERLAQPRRMSKPPPLPAPPQRERRRSLEPSPSIIAAICREQRSSSMECLQSRGNWRRRHKSPPANGEQQSKKALPNNFEYKRNLLCYKLRAWVDEGEALNRSAPKLLPTQQPQPQPQTAPPPAAEPQLKPPRKSAGCNATPMPTKRSGSDLHSKTPRKSKPWR
ncbi:putative uncharacterized protein DDB_G0271606 [Drosophila busckii]|uniref:putative uncharacterized protein DDB_G0271606 n=1 Tax=Drosophila busckii TaxID=30019 RepID=UPI00083F2152|nr:putative uncharacterized protein DDB_G0271606 [Drosophila busckii]